MRNHYLLQFFEYKHLPEKLQAKSKPFSELARILSETLPYNEESTMALRKLLEAKDCAVRSMLIPKSSTKAFLDNGVAVKEIGSHQLSQL